MTCEVIMDLMPMYADKSASKETKRMVERHLAKCPSCRRFLKSCRKTENKSAFSKKNLNKIREKLKCAECDISSVDAEFARLSGRIKKRNIRRTLIYFAVSAAMLIYIVIDIINTFKKTGADGGNK